MKKKVTFLFTLCMLLLLCVPAAVYGKASDKKSTAVVTSKKRTIAFRDSNGKNTGGKFKKLDVTLEDIDGVLPETTYIKMPKLPQIKGYRSLGWTTVKGGTKVQYKPGQEVNVTNRQFKFYLVRTNTCTVKFMTRGGKSPKSYKALWTNVRIGTKILLPGVPGRLDPVSFKNMGWSYKAGQKRKPDLKPGTYYTVKKNTVLYATWDARYVPLPERTE